MNFHLQVGHIAHIPIRIYVQISGDPKGIPVIYLHGGPGDHSDPEIPSLFPGYYVIQFDQRGCGKSTPPNHLRKNTTQLLIQDIETIRTHLHITNFVVAGGSWGTTLALAYAIKHPPLGLILRGVYDLSKGPDEVIDYMYPDLEDKIRRFTKRRSVTQVLRSSSKRAYMAALNDPHPMYVTTKPHGDSFKTQETLTIIGNHYEKHHFFISRKWIYANLHKIKCPVIIVQGRYDLVTPPIMAYNICNKLSHCKLHLLEGGHTYHDLIRGLKAASKEMKKYLAK